MPNGRAKRKPTHKELQVLKEYLKVKNKGMAYKAIYTECKDNSAATGGSRLLSRPHMLQAYKDALYSIGVTIKRRAKKCDELLDAQKPIIYNKQLAWANDNVTQLETLKYVNSIDIMPKLDSLSKSVDNRQINFFVGDNTQAAELLKVMKGLNQEMIGDESS